MVVLLIVLFDLIWWGFSFLPVGYVDGSWFLKNYEGMTLAPFIFFKNRRSVANERFRKHELCHIKQQRQWSPLLFLFLYAGEYLILRILRGYPHSKAYWNLSWEEEAREAEKMGNTDKTEEVP